MLKEIIKYLRENAVLLVLVFPALGGFVQIALLMSLSTSYLRFFSTTQLVADGILVGIYLYALNLIYFMIRKIYQERMDKKEAEDIKKASKAGIQKTFSKIYLVIMIVFLISIEVFLVKTEMIIKNLTVFIITSFVLVGIFAFLFESNCFLKLFKKIKIESNEFLVIFNFVGFFLCFVFIFLDNFSLPKNLQNIQNLPVGEIRYFNDKYIFIENKDGILVVKFDELFK